MKTKWLIVIIIGILGVLFLAGWLQQPKQSQPVQETVSLQKYKDPDNFYTISVPTTWTKTRNTATSITGLKIANPVKEDIHITQFTKPAEMGVTTQILSGQPTCPLKNKPNTTLAGLPAFYDAHLYTWTIPTTTATVLVSVAYPGTNSFHRPLGQTQITPFPSETVAADKKLAMSMIASLQFPELKPFTCK